MRIAPITRVVAAFLVLGAVTRVHAEDASGNEARDHFRKGLEHAQRNEVGAALRDFEEAYRIRPHHSVLYNIGQAYVLLDRPVDAVRALRRYLQEGGDAIDPRRKSEVTSIVEREERKIGALALAVEPATASVEIDGAKLPPNRAEGPLPLAAGHHAVLAFAPGYLPHAQSIRIEAGKTTTTKLELERAESAEAAPTGWLAVTCAVPDVEVAIDGNSEGKTPLAAPLVISPGSHRVRFSRRGYEDAQLAITADAERVTSVTCRMVPGADLPYGSKAELRVRANQSDAKVLVDGAPLTRTTVPAGRHRVEVAREGFQLWQSDVVLPADRVTEISATLEALPEYASERGERSRWRRTWAYGIGGTGLVLGATAVVLAMASSAEYDAWIRERDQLARTKAPSDYIDQLGRVRDKAMTVQRLDDWTIATGVVGGALMAVGTTLLLTSGASKSETTLAPNVSKDEFGFSWNGSW
jgi:hypothetical protein